MAGLRIEHTNATYGGFEADDSGSVASAGCPILDRINSAMTHVCAISGHRAYTNYFPGVQARYELDPNLIVRAALSSTIARPGFQQVTAATVVDNGGNITTGNPDLRPTTATGFDLALEQYLPHAGIASVGVFAKEIKDYIVKNVSQQVGGPQKSVGNLGIVDLNSFGNASRSHLYGFETNYVQHFNDRLPGLLGGLGVAVNWTWVDSRYRLDNVDPATKLKAGSRESLLPSTSRNTANAAILYDLGGLNLTLGGYFTGKNIFGVGNTAALDIWTQQRFTVDFGSQYRFTDSFNVYLNLKNLTNTALKFTEGPGEDRVIQREFYGVTVQAGVNYRL